MSIFIADFGCSCIFLQIKCSFSETYQAIDIFKKDQSEV